MKTYLLKPGERQAIAHAGETEAVAVAFNAKAWQDDYPAGTPQLMVTRPDGARVPVTVAVTDNLIAGTVPQELLVNPGMYTYTFVWVSGATQLQSGRCECLVLGSELQHTWAGVGRAPDWAERIFLAAGTIESAISGVLEARNHVEDMIGRSMRTAEDMEALQDTTEDTVYVKHTPDGGPLIYETQEGHDRHGVERADGSVVFPAAGQGSLPAANAPRRRLMGIIRSWIGRTNFAHTDESIVGGDLRTLFGANCEADGNGKFRLDCSGFVSAVLMGITYENSRYVLGKAASNIRDAEGELFSFPPSETQARSQGGLYTFEMARYFAERKKLFYLPEDTAQARQMLKFGDILFRSSSDSDQYFGIGHCAIVLGTAGNYVTVAQCSSDTGSRREPSVIHLRGFELENQLQHTLIVFARPDYKSDIFRDYQPVTENGSTVIRGDVLTPGSEIGLTTGRIQANKVWAACEDYIPVTPSSTVSYTGTVSAPDGRGNYYCRVHMYDEKYGHVPNDPETGKAKTILGGGTKDDLVIPSGVRYIRPSLGWLSSQNNNVYFADLYSFEITIKNRSGVEVIRL